MRKRAVRNYIAEVNRPKGDSIRTVVKRLLRHGLVATIQPHKTTVIIERPLSMPWQDFLAALRSVLQPRIGSMALSSQTGRAFICDNKGNRPGVFVRVM